MRKARSALRERELRALASESGFEPLLPSRGLSPSSAVLLCGAALPALAWIPFVSLLSQRGEGSWQGRGGEWVPGKTLQEVML